MRIVYVLHARYPTEKAYGSQVSAVCDALTELGHEVTLVTPSIRNSITQDGHAYYALSPKVNVVSLQHRDFSNAVFIPEFLRFACTMFFYRKAVSTFIRTVQADVLYIRSPFLLPTVVASGLPAVLELHTPPRRLLRRFTSLCNRCRLVVCLTQPMRRALEELGVEPSRMIVEGDAVTLSRFAHLPTLRDAKEKWNLPPERLVVGYIGSLVTMESLEKGVRELLLATDILRKTRPDILTWVVGGPVEWQRRYEQVAASLGIESFVRFTARIPGVDVPSAIAACDVCVYPAPASDHPFFLRDTSPLKLFEYLASGSPVVCANIPPVRDIVDERSVRFFIPGDAQSLADAVEDVCINSFSAQERAQHGKKIVQSHDWTVRMQRILAALQR